MRADFYTHIRFIYLLPLQAHILATKCDFDNKIIRCWFTMLIFFFIQITQLVCAINLYFQSYFILYLPN